MNEQIQTIAESCLAGEQLDRERIEMLVQYARADFFDMLYWANKIREKYFGNKVKICSIVPGRLGGCNQDCKFCAQSSRYNSGYEKPQVLSDQKIIKAAEEAVSDGAVRFGIVYSGKTISEKEFDRLEKLISSIKERFDLKLCASLGVITAEQAGRLVRSGLSGYNHNLETSERHFRDIVSTHSYADRVATIEAVKDAGLKLCAGGIFGIGETGQDRIDMALELRRLGADTVPMNFLHPIKGTPLGDMKTLEPREILSIIAFYRFILPQTTLKIAGGRTLNLRDMQSWIFYAGANSILSGNYLTTSGRAVEQDMQMLTDLGLEPDCD
ncbi:MAG: biotin synthase BioB [Planctomycetota bacterium]|jgi:biotin synthase